VGHLRRVGVPATVEILFVPRMSLADERGAMRLIRLNILLTKERTRYPASASLGATFFHTVLGVVMPCTKKTFSPSSGPNS
jgi:hypothetical protein